MHYIDVVYLPVAWWNAASKVSEELLLWDRIFSIVLDYGTSSKT